MQGIFLMNIFFMFKDWAASNRCKMKTLVPSDARRPSLPQTAGMVAYEYRFLLW